MVMKSEMGWLIAEWVFEEGRILGGACSCRTRWRISKSTKVDESDPEGTKKALLDKVKDLHDTLTEHHPSEHKDATNGHILCGKKVRVSLQLMLFLVSLNNVLLSR